MTMNTQHQHSDCLNQTVYPNNNISTSVPKDTIWNSLTLENTGLMYNYNPRELQ